MIEAEINEFVTEKENIVVQHLKVKYHKFLLLAQEEDVKKTNKKQLYQHIKRMQL